MENLKLNSCPVCLSTAIKFSFKTKDIWFMKNADEYEVYACTSCGCHFQNPFIPDAEVGKYYPNEDYTPFNKQSIIPLTYKHNPHSIYLRLLHQREEKNSSFSLLDLGCGGGGFLNSVKHYFPNAKIVGVDVSPYAIDTLRSQSIEGYVSSLYDFKVDRTFDYIFSSQVLEHLSNPKGFVESIRNHAHENTFIAVDVPNLDSLSFKLFRKNWVHIDMPRHQILYGKKSLNIIFKDFKTNSIFFAGSTLAIISCFKIKLFGSIIKDNVITKLFINGLSFTAKVFSLNKLYTDKIIWSGSLKK
jgi:SAM-dependent methyltransferase